MRARRFIIEGEWSGYSGQRRIVHRTVHNGAFKKLRNWAEEAGCIVFSDGTVMTLQTRDYRPGERVQEIHGYDTLIKDCAHHDVSSVADLQTAEANRR